MANVLDGVKIVELAQYVFVPACGSILADLGAEVIKVETPQGDPYRRLMLAAVQSTRKINTIFELNNRGKQSLAIDLKTLEGIEALRRLIKQADIFLTNFRPDALERLTLGAEQLAKLNPRLIYARGHGFGRRGPDAGKPGFDSTAFWARAGFGYVLTPPGIDAPITQRAALGDHLGAMNLAMGVTTALYQRERTGRGGVVDVSLLATGMWALSSDIVQAKRDKAPKPKAAPRIFMPLLRGYKTSDDRWVQLAFLEPDRYWPGLCERLDRPELAKNPKFATARLRAENGEECTGLLEEAFAAHTVAEWRERLKDFDAPWEIFQSIDELFEDEQVLANNYISEFVSDEGETYYQVSAPVEFDETPIVGKRAPSVGQHTDQTLRHLGYSDEEIDTMRRRGIINQEGTR